MMNHTPGPWRVCDYTGECGFEPERYVIGPNAELVADCYASTQDDLNLPENYQANARLIAAAPEMLAALEGLFKHCAMIHSKWGEGCNRREADAAIEAGRAIIARVKGGAS